MDCNYDTLKGMPLGSAYVPMQRFYQVMDAGKAIKYGTIFAELVLPFYGASAACNSRRRGSCEQC